MLLDLADIFLTNIAPILAIAALGYALGRFKQVDPAALGRVCFYIFSPMLIFRVTSQSSIQSGELYLLLAAIFCFFSIMLGLTVAVVSVQSFNRIQRAGIILCAIAPNMGNFGLPLVEFSFGAEALERAVVMLVCGTLTYNIVGIVVASGEGFKFRDAVRALITVPILYGGALGVVVNLADIPLPIYVSRPVFMLADAAIPAILVMLGLQLSQIRSLNGNRLLGYGVGLRLLLGPAVALLIVSLFHFETNTAVAIVLQGSMPIAVMTTVLSVEYELDAQFASSAVLISTLLSPITLSLLIYALRG